MRRYSSIALKLQAIENCTRTKNDVWYAIHSEHLANDLKGTAPSGSGFDNATELDFEKSGKGKLVFNTAFHHMNDDGYYTRWTHHSVIVTPTFDGIDIRVTGRDYREIKEYIAEMFYEWLLAEGGKL